MTPKEKAEELVEKFGMQDAWGEIDHGQKVDTAMIAVNELIELARITDSHVSAITKAVAKEHGQDWSFLKYWEEVKAELMEM